MGYEEKRDNFSADVVSTNTGHFQRSVTSLRKFDWDLTFLLLSKIAR